MCNKEGVILEMVKCEVYVDGTSDKYEGQYEVIDNVLMVEIFNYNGMGWNTMKFSSDVTYKEIMILDFSNKRYMYSSLFYNCGLLYGLVQSEKYKTDYFFETSNHESIESFSADMKFSEIKAYNAVLCHCNNNSALEITITENEVNYKINRKPKAIIIPIGINNIEKIELNTRATWSNKNDYYSVQIDTENYAKLYLTNAVDYQELIAYINELDVMIGSYMLVQVHSYETYVTNNEGTIFKLIHSHLSEEKRIKRPNHKPIKIDFEKYLEDVYKKINFRNTNSRNEFILLDFKRPTSLEDQYIFYFRYIDMYMGKRLMLEGKNTSNYARLSSFIDEYIEYFKKDKDYSDINNFKNELNSLRNHFVHEGYYFSDNQFSVTRNREHLYYQMIDYQWLYDIVKIFKLCSYLMLYKNILSIEIDEEELKMALL